VVKFQPRHFNGQYNGLKFSGSGKLIANGTASSPIVFTSFHDDLAAGDTDNSLDTISPAPGDWRGLIFDGGDSELSFVQIRYGGNIYTSFGNLDIRDGSSVVLYDSTISNGGSSGIVLGANSSSSLQRLIIRDNNDVGIDSSVGSGSSFLSDSTIENNIRGALRLSVENNMTFTNNTFSGSGLKTIELRGKTISNKATWPYVDGLVYILWQEGRHAIDDGASLIIEPGVVVKMYLRSGLMVRGSLVAEGTSDKPIVFTSWKNDLYGGDTNIDGATSGAPGDWGGIYFDESENSSIKNAVLEYGGLFADDFGGFSHGFVDRNLVHVDNSIVDIFNARLSDGLDTGLFVSGLNTLTFASSTINNVPRAVDVYTDVNWSLELNRFGNNSAFAMRVSGEGTVDARNNWWGNDTGPTHADNPDGSGGGIFGNVLFDPWIGKVPERNPVILIPGILGTELKIGDEVLWLNLLKMIFDRGDDFMEMLELSGEGRSINDILISDVLREPVAGFDYFKGLVEEFINQGYIEDEYLFVFPYDWRLDNRMNADLLSEKILDVLSQTGANKVDIVAHSMGGLITKQYILDEGDEKIDTVVFVGTPHTGSPNAAKTLMFGDNLGIQYIFSFLSEERIREMSQNMKSIYQLLPSKKYLEDNGSYMYDLTQRQSFDYLETNQFLADWGVNQNHLMDAESFHTEELDSFNGENLDIFTINGCTQPTLSIIIRRGDNQYDIQLGAGDGTVPLVSAEAIVTNDNNRFYANNAEHSRMPSQDGIRDLVAQIVDNQLDRANLPRNIEQSASNCTLSGRLISVHSPVDINAFDENGNHVGPNEDNDVDINIDGATHITLGDDKFVFLPSTTTLYNITLDGTSTGTFRLRISDYANSTVSSTYYFHDIQVNSSSTGSINFGDSGVPIFEYDQTGSGDYVTISASAILGFTEAADLHSPTTTLVVEGLAGANGWYKSIVTTTLNSVDDNSGVLETEFSMDNGDTWQTYANPLVFVQEGSTTLLYRSTDRAGNTEKANEKIIRIDTIVPEIILSFDRLSKDMMVAAFDTNVTTSTKSGNLIRVADIAGNTTTLRLSRQDTSNTFQVTLFSLQYNQELPKRLTNNTWRAEWLETASGTTKIFRQQAKVLGGQTALSLYHSQRDQTFERERRSNILNDRLRRQNQGINLFTIKTDRGELVYNF
jgi:pimeloyl-ACP methyl ester carboxylesterase